MSADGPLFNKFEVRRVDGAEHDPKSKHHGGCDYFVLDVSHDPYALPALVAYADACRATHPQLAASLRERVTGRSTA